MAVPRMNCFFVCKLDKINLLVFHSRCTRLTQVARYSVKVPELGSKPAQTCGKGRTSSAFIVDPRVAFKHKTTWELVRALLVLKACSYDVVVDNSVKLMTWGQRLMGTRLFSAFMKPVFYRQFVAGNSRREIKNCVNQLEKARMGPLLAVPLEEDVNEGTQYDDHYEKNYQTMVSCVRLAADLGSKFPMMQLRMTGLFPANFLAALSKLCPDPSNNPDLVKEVAVAMERGTNMTIPGLSAEDNEHLTQALSRLKVIGELGEELNVLVMVDAEYTYVNNALNLFTLAMMLNYNRKSAIVLYTYQNYLKNASELLRRDIEFIDKCGVCFGVKLVRGAYMDKERRLAKEKGYPSPINDTLEETSARYHDSMELLLARLAQDPDRTRVAICSHNHQTMELALERFIHYKIKADLSTSSVLLCQLYGIGDDISFSLGSMGYPVYKSIPYGSVIETLPYLSRRAHENRCMLQGSRGERDLLMKALKGRFRGNHGHTRAVHDG